MQSYSYNIHIKPTSYTQMTHSVIGIRAHRWSQVEERLYNKLLQVFPKTKIFVIMDETSGDVVVPSYINKISLGKDFIENNQLLDFTHFNRKVSWLCGDYFYYALQESIVAKFYWLIEPDVDILFRNIDIFFTKTNSYNEDALLVDFMKAQPEHCWFKSGELIHKEVYRCLFPLSRLSSEAIKLCKIERQKLSKYYKDNSAFAHNKNPIGIYFPNDETLVANTLVRDDKSIKSLNEIFPKSFEYFTVNNWFSIPEKHAIDLVGDHIIHPVRPISMFEERLTWELTNYLNKINFSENFIVDENNINGLVNLFRDGLSRKIKEKLQANLAKFKINQYFIDIKQIITSKINDFPGENKLEIRDDNVLVFEVCYNNRDYVLEFILKGSNLICYAFQRNVTNNDWLENFRSINTFKLDNNKAILFISPVNDSDVIQKYTKDILLIFKESLQGNQTHLGNNGFLISVKSY